MLILCSILSVYVYDMTALGTAPSKSDVNMESGSTSGAVFECIHMFSFLGFLVTGVGKVCGCFKWGSFFLLFTSVFLTKGNIGYLQRATGKPKWLRLFKTHFSETKLEC